MIPQQEFEELVKIVDRLVSESGRSQGFDARRWLSEWIQQPVAALGGAKPVEFMSQAGGFERVRDLLLRMQSGAYC